MFIVFGRDISWVRRVITHSLVLVIIFYLCGLGFVHLNKSRVLYTLPFQTSIKVQKGHTKVRVNLVRDFYVENTPVEAQSNQSLLWSFFLADKVCRWMDELINSPWWSLVSLAQMKCVFIVLTSDVLAWHTSMKCIISYWLVMSHNPP